MEQAVYIMMAVVSLGVLLLGFLVYKCRWFYKVICLPILAGLLCLDYVLVVGMYAPQLSMNAHETYFIKEVAKGAVNGKKRIPMAELTDFEWTAVCDIWGYQDLIDYKTKEPSEMGREVLSALGEKANLSALERNEDGSELAFKTTHGDIVVIANILWLFDKKLREKRHYYYDEIVEGKSFDGWIELSSTCGTADDAFVIIN